jgi:16S rRNA U516 pseudouridylate synthase RsuA-like enzyme
VKLKRIRVASILLGQLEKGRWRYLSEHEVKRLHELTKD